MTIILEHQINLIRFMAARFPNPEHWSHRISWTFLHSVNTISAINFPFRNDRERIPKVSDSKGGEEQRQETERKRETECNELCMKASIRGLSEHSP